MVFAMKTKAGKNLCFTYKKTEKHICLLVTFLIFKNVHINYYIRRSSVNAQLEKSAHNSSAQLELAISSDSIL